MKRLIFILILAVFLFGWTASARAAADQTTSTPADFFWRFKIWREHVMQNWYGMRSAEKELDYIVDLMARRQWEINTLKNKYGNKSLDISTSFDNYSKVLAEYKALQNKYIALLDKIDAGKRLEILKESAVQRAYDPSVDIGDVIISEMNNVRDQVSAARLKGDEKTEAELIKRLRDLQASLLDNNVILNNAQFILSWDNLSAAASLIAADKINYYLDVVRRQREDFDNMQKSPQYQSGKELFDQAKKLLDQMEGDLKIMPLDDYATYRADDIFTESMAGINAARRAIWKKAEEEELAKRLPQEIPETEPKAVEPLPTPPAPEKTPAKTPAKAPTPVPPKTPLRTTPSNTVSTKPLILIYFPALNYQVGDMVDVQYSAQNGLAPYYFKLGSGVGFPPSGVILDTNGKLYGKIKAAGTYTFSVCVVDTAGLSVCKNTVLTVAAAPAPEPEPVAQTQLSISAGTPRLIVEDPSRSWDCQGEVSGSASGPVGAVVRGSPAADGGTRSCGSWSSFAGGGCQRQDGQPEQTQWTFRIPGSIPGSGDMQRRSVSVSAEGQTAKILNLSIVCD